MGIDQIEVFFDAATRFILWFNFASFNQCAKGILAVGVEDLKALRFAKVVRLEDQLLDYFTVECLLRLSRPLFNALKNATQLDQHQKKSRQSLLTVDDRSIRRCRVGKICIEEIRLESLKDILLDLLRQRLSPVILSEANFNVVKERLDLVFLPFVLALVDVDEIRSLRVED